MTVAGCVAIGLSRTLLIMFAASLFVIGVTQIFRTLRLGPMATNADAVILRAGLTVGAGVAFGFAATLAGACAR